MKRLGLVLLFGVISGCAAGVSQTTPIKIKAATLDSLDISAQGFEQLCKEWLNRAQGEFNALALVEGSNSVESVLEPLNQLWIAVDRGVNLAGLFAAVHPKQAVRDAASRCELEYRKLITNIGLSPTLYKAVAVVNIRREGPVIKRYVKNILRDFRRSGVDRDEATRAEIQRLQEELAAIGQEFGKNIRSSVRTIELDSIAGLDGLPKDYVDRHPPGPDGKIQLTTNYSDYLPFMAYAKNDALRLEFYKEFRKRGYPNNKTVLDRLLAKRYELATLLGYDNWAHYVVEDKMIRTPFAANNFIDRISELSKKRAEVDYQKLLARLQKDIPEAQSVGDWQKSYVENLIKKEEYQLDTQAVREYFTYNKVRDGIFKITGDMFGVEYRSLKEAVTWHDSVEAYELVDLSTDSVVGHFYLDMHPREKKYKHAAVFPIQSGAGGVQIPIASLVCNFPQGDEPMEHAQVETFFQEFGHVLHHLFGGAQKWVGLSGFNTEWDFVQAPSLMLKEWAWNFDSLKLFATDKDGNVITEELVEAMNRSRGFGKGLWVGHQTFYAAVSLNYYNRDPAGLDTTELLKELQGKYSPFDYVDDTYFQYGFGQLDGYSAIYYADMWSLVIAKDLFSAFEESGLMNKEVASRYRKFILQPGGSKDAVDMVRDFLERDYAFDAFANWLNAK